MERFWYFPRYAHVPNGISNLTLTKQEAQKCAAAEREAYIDKKHFQKEPAVDLQAIVFATYEKDKHIQVNDLMTGEWFSVPVADWERMNWHMGNQRSRYRTVHASILMNGDGSMVITPQAAPAVHTATSKPRRSKVSVYVSNHQDEKKLLALLPNLRQMIPTLDWDTTWDLEDKN